MSDEAKSIVTPEWIDALVRASFGGAPPAAIGELVDAAACAAGFAGSKLGVLFTVAGGPERPRVRVRSEGEADRLLGVAKQRLPTAAAVVAALAPQESLYETDGDSWRVFAMGVAGSKNDAGRVIDEEADLEIVPFATFDAVGAPAAVAAQASGFAAGVKGQWFALRSGGQTRKVVWTSDNAWEPDLDDKVAALGSSPGLAAALAAYAAGGFTVQPYAVEFDGATVSVCLWGARVPERAADLPEIFAGGVPSAAAFADEVAQTVPEKDQEAARELVRDHLFPAMMALQPTDTDAAQHAGAVWRFLLDALAFEAPFDRLQTLQRLSASHRLAVIQQEALQLALARYVGSHDVTPPAELSDALAGLDAAELKARATGLKEEVERLRPISEADPDFDLRRLPGTVAELATITSLLDRAISGEFAAAEGALHDWLVKLGPTGYDDDPSAVGIEDIDLEESSRDAVLEEALAEGEGEDRF